MSGIPFKHFTTSTAAFALGAAIVVTLILGGGIAVSEALRHPAPGPAPALLPALDATVLQDTPAPPPEPAAGDEGATEGTTAVTYGERVQEAPQAAVAAPAGMSDAEARDYVLDRESHHDIYADNGGTYLGIGQLHRDYYPRFIGMAYEETLPPDHTEEEAYALQLQAADAYVAQRYPGGWPEAARHVEDEGWY